MFSTAACRNSRSAAARASSVIVAPASMRAISSCRAAPVHLGDAGRDAVGAAGLGDQVVGLRARRDLRRMGDRQHLHALGKPRQPLADGVRHRAADAGVDLVEDQRRRRAAIGERHLQRQQEARQLAAGRDLHQRAGRVPGLVRTQNSTWSMPSSVRLSGFARQLDDELGPLELQRRQLGHDRPRQRDRRRIARLGQPRRLAVVEVARAGGLLFQRVQPLLAGIEIGKVGSMRIAQLRQVVDRHGKLARRGAQRKQPLLGCFRELRVEFAGPHRRFDGRLRGIERNQRPVERLDDLVEQARRFGRLALQPAQQAGQLRHRRRRARQHLLRIGDVGGDLLGPHHRGALLRKLGLLAGLRVELRQFGGRGAQIFRLARRRLDLGAVARKFLVGAAPALPASPRRCRPAPT